MNFRSFYLSLKIIFRIAFKNIELLTGIIIGFSFFVVSLMLKGDGGLNGEFFKIQSLNSNKYPLSFGDIKSLRASTLPIKSISSEESFMGIITNKFNDLHCEIIGGGEDYKNFVSMNLMFGRFFSEHEHLKRENVIVIDNFTSLKLFGVENSLGREVFLENGEKRGKYKVIGIVKNSINRDNLLNIRGVCIIPIENFLREFKGELFFNYICVSVKDGNEIFKVSNSIINFLKVKNNTSKDVYQIVKMESVNPRFKGDILKIFNLVFAFLNLINFKKFIICILGDRDKNFKIIFNLCLLSSLILGFISINLGLFISFLMKTFLNLNLSFNFLDILKIISIFILNGFISWWILYIKTQKFDLLNYE